MNHRPEIQSESGGEKALRFFRNANILGAIAVTSAYLVAPEIVPLELVVGWVGFNALEISVSETIRQRKKTQRLAPKTGQLAIAS